MGGLHVGTILARFLGVTAATSGISGYTSRADAKVPNLSGPVRGCGLGTFAFDPRTV